MPRARTVAAARSTRSSLPSGSTMRRRSPRARSTRPYSNINGVTTLGRATPSSRVSRLVSTWRSNIARAVSYRRCESAARRPRVFMMRTAVSYVPRSVAMIGSDEPSPSMRRTIVSGSSNPPLRTTPASEGNVPEALASRVANSTSVRSAGMTMTADSIRRGSTLTIDMPATTTPSTSRVSSSGSPLISSPSTERSTPRMEGAMRNLSSGSAHTGTVRPVGVGAASTTRRTDATTSSRASGSARLTMTANTSARSWSSSGMVSAAICPTSCAVRATERPRVSPCPCCARPPRTRSTGAPRFAAMRALYASSAGLPTSV